MKMRATKPCLVLLILVIISVVSISESAATLIDTMEVDEFCENQCQQVTMTNNKEKKTCKDKCNGYYNKAKMMKSLEDVNSEWKEGICGTACIAASVFQIDFDDCLGRCSSALPGLMKKTSQEANFDWEEIACLAACKVLPSELSTGCSYVCRMAVHELIKKSILQAANEAA